MGEDAGGCAVSVTELDATSFFLSPTEFKDIMSFLLRFVQKDK